MHNPLQREAVKSAVRASLAAYLADIWLNAPQACAVTVDLAIDDHGEVSAIAHVTDRNDVSVLGETL